MIAWKKRAANRHFSFGVTKDVCIKDRDEMIKMRAQNHVIVITSPNEKEGQTTKEMRSKKRIQ